ncbi:hypothetical protein ABID19_006631 [Mesorhizobium robiniae]|uniref:Recombinase domain-containing protein n=1 Tax=Mesorhizobium robiniae TaxID=559315 RepID=A0ABV2GZ53_9HYPH
MAAVRQLVLIANDDLIAGILNRNGLVTGHGNRWTRERVTALSAAGPVTWNSRLRAARSSPSYLSAKVRWPSRVGCGAWRGVMIRQAFRDGERLEAQRCKYRRSAVSHERAPPQGGGSIHLGASEDFGEPIRARDQTSS